MEKIGNSPSRCLPPSTSMSSKEPTGTHTSMQAVAHRAAKAPKHSDLRQDGTHTGHAWKPDRATG